MRQQDERYSECAERLRLRLRWRLIGVAGDVVSNMKLDDVLKTHQLRRKKRQQAIMTSLLKKAAPCHRTRAGEDATIIAVDKHTSMLLHFDNSTQPRLCLDAGTSRSCLGYDG